MIKASISLGKDTPARLRGLPDKLDSAVARTVNRLAIELVGLVKEKLSGEVLKVRTGRLRRSIHKKIDRSASRVEARVGTNVEYGKTHELGLTIPAHIVEVRRAKALAWQQNGRTMFAKRVRIPAVKMPQRSFLRASLDQMEPYIKAELEAVVGKTLLEKVR